MDTEYEEWVNANRDHATKVRDALRELLSTPPTGRTVVKDRSYLADVFRDIGQVLDTRSLEGAMFEKK